MPVNPFPTTSHINKNGTFIPLSEPTPNNSAHFFARSVLQYEFLNNSFTSLKSSSELKSSTNATIERDTNKLKAPKLSIASARLNSPSITELSKSINLCSLVLNGDYLDVAVVSAEHSKTDDTKTLTVSETLEANTRALYLLKRKKNNFSSIMQVLYRHSRHCRVVIGAQRIIDRRLLELRESGWRLEAAEHGQNNLSPLQSDEAVYVDLDMYGSNRGETMRTKRRIPRYASIELGEGYSIIAQHKKQKNHMYPSLLPQTIAEPFPRSSKVPILFLQLQLEKSSTGYIQSQSLISKDNVDTNDEAVIQTLQHSLFCANLFEKIHREVENSHKIIWLGIGMQDTFLPHSSWNGFLADDMAVSVVYCHEGEIKVQLNEEYSLIIRLVELNGSYDDNGLSSEMSESHVSQSDYLVGEQSGSLSIKELEVLCCMLLHHIQTLYHLHSRKEDENTNVSGECTGKVNSLESNFDYSGSTLRQSRSRRRRIGLYSSQSSLSNIVSLPNVQVHKTSNILQSCIRLGVKFIIVGKVRKGLKHLSQWFCQVYPNFSSTLQIEWFPYSVFYSHSRFLVSCGSQFSDVHIDGSRIIVNIMQGDNYQSVSFHSCHEFLMYLKNKLNLLVKQYSSKTS